MSQNDLEHHEVKGTQVYVLQVPTECQITINFAPLSPIRLADHLEKNSLNDPPNDLEHHEFKCPHVCPCITRTPPRVPKASRFRVAGHLETSAPHDPQMF